MQHKTYEMLYLNVPTYLSTQPILISCDDFQYYAKAVSGQLDILSLYLKPET